MLPYSRDGISKGRLFRGLKLSKKERIGQPWILPFQDGERDNAIVPQVVG